MKKFFQDKIVWIIGASSGIGEALVYNLNALGSKLIISSRKKEELNRVKEGASHPENIHVLTLDLLDFSLFKEKTREAFSIHERIDYVFLNGGTSSRGTVAEMKFEVQQKLMNLNYFSYVGLTKEILPFFKRQKEGAFVVTSSIMGKIGTPNRSAYAASKHALHGFFDCLRAEVASDNIKVILLVPGHVSTQISLHTLMPDGSPKMEKNRLHEKGLSKEKAAFQIIKAVKKNKKEVYIGKKYNQEHLSLYLFRFFPELLHKIIQKIKTE
ncbi:MAG: SDR family NAD(P)-dependent oxidoreductase [Flavobacteriaceae bacterium]|jgi:short-subunit dehydrogenase|nr:SDR family NAD(P)-dependent oxidoreductase [Flavobacteriaceae bacterium]